MSRQKKRVALFVAVISLVANNARVSYHLTPEYGFLVEVIEPALPTPPLVYIYPSPPGQSPQDLMKCIQQKFPNDDITKDSGHKIPGIAVYAQEDIGEWFLHEQLLRYKSITNNRSQADYFVVNPMPLLRRVANSSTGANHVQRQVAWTKILQSSQEFQNSPRKHIFICQSWMCHRLVEKGLKKQVAKMTYLIHERNSKWPGLDLTTFDPRTQILVVPYVGHSDILPFTTTSATSHNDSHNDQTRQEKKKHMVTFVGSVKRDTAWRFPIAEMRGINFRDKGLMTKQTTEEFSVYANEMMSSTFCLVPTGDTPSSRRLFDAMLAGCIPVFVGIPYDRPFEDIIPYESFSIRLNGTKYLNGQHQQEIDKLLNFTAEEIDVKRNEMARYVQYIDWRHGNSTLEAILHGMENMSKNNVISRNVTVVDWT